MTSAALTHTANRIALSMPATCALALLQLPWGLLPLLVLQGLVTGFSLLTGFVVLMLASGMRVRVTPRDLALGSFSGVCFFVMVSSAITAATCAVLFGLWLVLRVAAATLAVREERTSAY